MAAGKKQSVLVVGVDPLKLDPAEWGVTAERNAEIRAAIAASETDLREAGYTTTTVLLGIEDDLSQFLTPQLRAHCWDCVVIGGGIRKPERLLGLFEDVVNAVHAHAPRATIAFNSRPDDVLASVIRAVSKDRK